MSTTQITANCDRCGAPGPLDDEHGYCAVCAADWSGWEKGRRMMALLGVAIAVDNAVDSSAECSPEQVRAIVEVTLAQGGYFEDDAIALVDPPGRLKVG